MTQWYEIIGAGGITGLLLVIFRWLIRWSSSRNKASLDAVDKGASIHAKATAAADDQNRQDFAAIGQSWVSLLDRMRIQLDSTQAQLNETRGEVAALKDRSEKCEMRERKVIEALLRHGITVEEAN